ncbi:MAG: MCE family protein [Polyangiaceae bacterium]|nr:MCE family protein [Polyangiaceae bacterium]
MSQRSIEVKVGALILVALALLAGFIVVMGGFTLEPTLTIHVDFENPGALQAGAPVRMAGMQIGKVAEVQFRGGEIDSTTQEPAPPIRVVAKLEQRYRKALRANSRWYVTTNGLLGEQFLAVEPGTAEQPVLWDGAVVTGVSPPRLDLLLSESYELLHKAYASISRNETKIEETFNGLHSTLKGTGDFFRNNREKIDAIVSNTESLTMEANDTMREARERYVTGPQVDRILNNVERATGTLDRELPPLVRDGRAVLGDAKKITGALSSDDQLERYRQITRDVGDAAATLKGAATDAKGAVADTRDVVSRVKRGQGTLGALVMDEAIYDDLQELLRDLKHNPWKLFWRE